MTPRCRHHPDRPAVRVCPVCNSNFCEGCTKTQSEQRHQALCPGCRIPTEPIDGRSEIEPFWNRLPKFFTYPLSPQPLMMMAAITAAGTFIRLPGPLGILLYLAIWGVMIRYSFEALRTTARGDLTPPPVNSRTISAQFQQVFKQVGIYIIIGLVFGGVFASAGAAAGILFLVLAILFLPAMVILVVTTDSLVCALNPVMFVRLATRIGWGYLLMYFFLILLGGAPTVAANYIIRFLPPGIQPFLFGLAKNYYTLISYHLMGYVMYQYHSQIGYEIDTEPAADLSAEPVPPASENPEVRLLDQINGMIQEGNLDDAIAHVGRETAQTGISDLRLSERYFSLLKMQNRTRDMLAYAPNHLSLLSEHNRRAPACEIYLNCIGQDKNFLPRASALLKIAGWLNETGRIRDAVAAYSRFVKAFPEDRQVPRAYFRAAQLFHDRLLEPERARKILNGLIRKYPDDDIVPQVRNYLSHMARP